MTLELRLFVIFVVVLEVFGEGNLEQLVSEQEFGRWTNITQAKPTTNSSSQYFLCGFDFLQRKWTKVFQNCQCNRRWYRSRRGWSCSFCENVFWNTASGFIGVFCRHDNWTDQNIKEFRTGSKSSRYWRSRIMCPINQYAVGYAGKYGMYYGELLGFHGMVLKCSTKDLKTGQNVEDNQYYTGSMLIAKAGNFISKYKLKYEVEGRLSGFTAYAEPLPPKPIPQSQDSSNPNPNPNPNNPKT